MIQAVPSSAAAHRAKAWRMLAVIVLVALALRLVVTSLPNFENLMDADHIHAWEQGNVAEALLAGHGFGSPFESTSRRPLCPRFIRSSSQFSHFSAFTP